MDMLSGFIISQTDSRPMYRQVMEQIRQRVAIGDWQPEQRIPSIRELAIAIKVSVITIKRAYLELEREGVIVSRQGRGSFVTENADLGAELHRRELKQLAETLAHRGAVSGANLDEILSHVREAYERLMEHHHEQS